MKRFLLMAMVCMAFGSGAFAQWNSTQLTNNALFDRNGPRSFAVDTAGTLHATWVQGSSITPNRVMYAQKPCGQSWTLPEEVSDTVTDAASPTLAVDPYTGEVAVAWVWPPSSSSDIYLKSGGPGNWTNDTVSNTSFTDVTPTLAYDDQGKIHLTWSSDNNGTWKIHYANNRSGSFVEQRIQVSNPGPYGGGASPKIALDPNGAPSITYREGNFSSYKIERIYLTHPDSTNWFREYINSPLGEEFTGDHLINDQGTIMAVVSGNSGFGFPVDAYYTEKPQGGAWSNSVAIDLLENSHVVSIVLDPQGWPHVGLDAISGNLFTGNLYEAYFDGSSWQNDTINNYNGSGNNYGVSANVVVDHQGNSHALAWMDDAATVNSAEVYHFRTGNCVSVNCNVLADFMANDFGFCLGDTAVFSNLSTGATTYEWYENGNLFDTTANATFPATTPGIYDIMLIAYDGSCADTSDLTIQVFANPISGFSFTSNLLQVDFTASVSGPIQMWNWDLGDGNSSGMQNPTHVYVQPGVYVVCLAVSDINGCMDTHCDTVTVVETGLEGDLLAGVSLYPNPAGELVWLEVPGEWGVVEVEIVGMDGRELSHFEGDGKRMALEIGDLATGCYAVVVRTEGWGLHRRLLIVLE